MSQSKSEAGISLKFGNFDLDKIQDRQISKIQVKAHTTKNQIADFKEKIQTKLGLSKVPFMMAVIPDYFPVENVLAFNQIWKSSVIDQTTRKINQDGDNFYMIDYKDQNDGELLLLKKLNKVFSQLNTTKKEAFAQAEFYDLGKRMEELRKEQKTLRPWSVLFNRCFIRGWIDLSKQFWELFLSLAEKLSPKFAQSPLMAVLPLMERASLELEFDSVQKLDENVKIIFEGKSDEELFKKMLEKKDKMMFYLSFEELGYLEVSVDMEILAVAQFKEGDD